MTGFLGLFTGAIILVLIYVWTLPGMAIREYESGRLGESFDA